MSNQISIFAGQLLGAAVKSMGNPLAEALHEELEPKIQAALDERIDGPVVERLQSGVEVTRRVIQRTRRKMRERGV